MLLHRREFLKGLFAAPAIVAVGNIMPVRSLERLIPVLDPLFLYPRQFDDLMLKYGSRLEIMRMSGWQWMGQDAAFSGRLGVLQGCTFIEQVLVPMNIPSQFPGHEMVRLHGSR